MTFSLNATDGIRGAPEKTTSLIEFDPMSNAGRTVEPETRASTSAGGRRKFGDACLGGEQATGRANPHFLVHGPVNTPLE